MSHMYCLDLTWRSLQKSDLCGHAEMSPGQQWFPEAIVAYLFRTYFCPLFCTSRSAITAASVAHDKGWFRGAVLIQPFYERKFVETLNVFHLSCSVCLALLICDTSPNASEPNVIRMGGSSSFAMAIRAVAAFRGSPDC